MEEIKNKQADEQVPVTANEETQLLDSLKKENESLRAALKEEKESRRRCYDYWQEAESKVRALKLIIAAAAKQPGFNAREVFEAIG